MECALVARVEDVQKLERLIEADGTPLSELMEHAGCAVADEVRARISGPASAVALCGSGNNGGDGWVAARILAEAGWKATVVTPRSPEELSTEPARSAALEAVARTSACKNPIAVLVRPSGIDLEEALAGADVVIDAILGTGFSGAEVREPYASWIRAANAHRRSDGACQIIAADVPSGLSAATGLAATPCIEADCTVVMLMSKPGIEAHASRRFTGSRSYASLFDIAPYLDKIEVLNRIPL